MRRFFQSAWIAAAVCLFCGTAAFAVVGTGEACCSGPPRVFSGQFLTALSARDADEPLDAQASWIQEQLRDADRDQLVAVQAAIAGYCARECPQNFVGAQVVVDALVEDQERRVDRDLQLGDRWTTLLSAIAGAIAATIGLSILGSVRRRRRVA